MAVGSHSGGSTARLSVPEMVMVKQSSGALRASAVEKDKAQRALFLLPSGGDVPGTLLMVQIQTSRRRFSQFSGAITTKKRRTGRAKLSNYGEDTRPWRFKTPVR